MAAVTIADLIRDRRLLWVYCRDCGRERDVDPATLPLPGDWPIPEVGLRMRCSTCGSRKVHTARPSSTPVALRLWGASGAVPASRQEQSRGAVGERVGTRLALRVQLESA